MKNFESKAVKDRFNKERFNSSDKETFRTTNRLQSRTDKRITYILDNGIINTLEKRN